MCYEAALLCTRSRMQVGKEQKDHFSDKLKEQTKGAAGSSKLKSKK